MVNSPAGRIVSNVSSDVLKRFDVTPGVLERALLDIAVPVALLDGTDPHLPVIWVNRAFEVTTGYDAASARQHQRDPVPPGARRPDALNAVREAVREGRTVAQALSLRRADGSVYTCLVHLSPTTGADGTGTYWVAALQDLTEQLSHDAEQAALVEAERRERMSLGLLAQVADLLMDVDDRMTPLHEIASLLRHAIVGWAAFYVNDGGLRPAEGVDANKPPSGKGRQHGGRSSLVDEGADVGPDAVQQLLDGVKERPIDLPLDGWFARSSASAWLTAHVRAHARSNLTEGPARVAVFPVMGRRRVLGLLVAIPRVGRGLDGLDQSARTVLELTARRVGLVIDNARLYDREHRLAETLQRAMLPQQAEVDGLDVWTYYAPNSENVQVGGDWYDVLQIAPDVVGVVIGDVVGHDVEAAAAMGQLRSVVRSYAYDITTPGSVLERVDQLVAGMRIPRSAGLVLSTLTRTGDEWRLDYSRAGHLPVLHVRDGAVTALLTGGGPMIGFGGHGRTTQSVELAPGDVLVYYTDGLIERRDRGLRDGIDQLTKVVGGVTARDSAGIGEDILSKLAGHTEDDVAVVVVRVPDPRDHLERGRSPRRRRWSLPSEPASIGRARHAVVRTCHAWDMPNAANAELVVSELVANAVLHGFGHVSLQLYDTGDGLRIEVEDGNPAPPIATDGHPGRVGGFGIKIVERLADWGWRPSTRGKLVWAKVRPGDLPPAGS